MNAQMVIPDFAIQVQTSVSKKTLSSQDSNKAGKSNFQDLLKTATKDTAEVTDSKEKRTYSQIVNNSKSVSVRYKSAVNNADNTEAVNNEETEKLVNEKVVNASNSVLEGIAILLGIDLGSLKQLMNQLNINPEDLLDPAKVDDIIDELSINLELTSEQSKVLQDSVNMFSKLARQSIDENTNKENWVVVEDVSIEVVNNDSSKAKSLIHLDEDIRQLASSIKNTKADLFDNVPEKFSALLENFLSNEKVNSVKDDAMTKEDKVEARNDIKVTEATPNKEMNQNANSDLFNTGDKSKDDSILLNQVNDNINQVVQKDDFVAKLQNVSTQQRIVRNELMKQVVEQAKVLVDQNRSEMVMQLKPESLGKLTLKIVTENGIVAAKFVAENQQVRQVLETNMQTLKDSLEKQGMSIQNVSVSVGQEGGQAFEQREAFERRTKKGTGLKNDDSIFSAIETEIIKTNNPYELTENSIDVIA